MRPVLLVGVFVLVSACKSGPTATDYLDDAHRAIDGGHYQEAETFLDLARDRGAPERRVQELRAKVARNRGVQRIDSGDDRGAFESFVRAGNLDPRRKASSQTYLRALEVGERMGLPPSELAVVAQKAVDANPSSSRARRAAGKYWESAGNHQKALESYLWLWQSDRSQNRIGRRLASVYRELGEVDDAIAVLQDVLEHTPNDSQAALKLANLYDDADRVEQARRLYEQLVERFPDKPGLLLRYARFLERHGDEDRARKFKKRAYDQMPGTDQREMRELR